METRIPADSKRASDESDYVKKQLASLSRFKVKTAATDDGPEPSKRARKPHIAQVPVVEPPTPTEGAFTAAADASTTLQLKLSKPATSYTLSAVPLNTPVQTAKALLATQERARCPPPADMKWLLKGKVLNDDKLLSEYIQPDQGEAAITIMLKPGAATFPANTVLPDPIETEAAEDGKPASSAPPPPAYSGFKFPSTSSGTSPNLMPAAEGGRSHIRVPSLTLNTSSIELDPAQQQPATSHRRSPSLSSQFQSKITDPAFWQATHQYLVDSFGEDAESSHAADRLWENWFGASKVWLTPNEVAKVRDQVGIHAMGGL